MLIKKNICNSIGIEIMKNQLFKVVPSYEFVEIFLKLFIHNGFDIYYQFLREDIITKKNITKNKNYFFFRIILKNFIYHVNIGNILMK